MSKVYVVEVELSGRQVVGVYSSLEAAKNGAASGTAKIWHVGPWEWKAHDAHGPSWTAPLAGWTHGEGWVAISEHDLVGDRAPIFGTAETPGGRFNVCSCCGTQDCLMFDLVTSLRGDLREWQDAAIGHGPNPVDSSDT